ncbi:MAG: DUF2231 domain-containing protein [Nocardioides sp.]
MEVASMELDGLPVHVLVVHAVVVFAPLAAVVAAVYAAVPRWRWVLRGVLIALTVTALVTAFVATFSGDALLADRAALKSIPAVNTHIEAGERLRNGMIAFTALVLLATWRLGGPSALVSGRGGREVRPGNSLDRLLSAVLILASVAIVIVAVLAGHSGATAVWG